MSTKRKKTNPRHVRQALQQLELLSDKRNQRVLHQLDQGETMHLQALSKRCGQSPSQTKKQLDQLKEAGLVFSPKRYPSAFAANKVKIVKIKAGLKKCAL